MHHATLSTSPFADLQWLVLGLVLWCPAMVLAGETLNKELPDRQTVNRLETEQRLREKQRQLDQLEELDERKDTPTSDQAHQPSIRNETGRPDRCHTGNDTADDESGGSGERVPCIDTGTQP